MCKCVHGARVRACECEADSRVESVCTHLLLSENDRMLKHTWICGPLQINFRFVLSSSLTGSRFNDPTLKHMHAWPSHVRTALYNVSEPPWGLQSGSWTLTRGPIFTAPPLGPTLRPSGSMPDARNLPVGASSGAQSPPRFIHGKLTFFRFNHRSNDTSSQARLPKVLSQ